MKPGDLVYIVFDDVQHRYTGWSPVTDLPKRGRYVAVGYLIKQTKRSTYVANVLDGDQAFCSYTIPTPCIRKIRRLVRRRKRDA